MSKQTRNKRITPVDIRKCKGADPVVCLTAYTYPVAQKADPHVDLLLVGDSLGVVIYGLANTLGVTIEMMVRHTQAVVRASKRACVVSDMPFGTYEASKEMAFASAWRLIGEGQAQAIKLEGGRAMAPTVDFLSKRSIPVMGHVGMTPQAVNQLGGFAPRGMDDKEAQLILDDAMAIADAGAFALVVEAVSDELGAAITEAISIPVIGIGAGMNCDGQILVTDDMLGLFDDFQPRFVRRFATIGDEMNRAFQDYAQAVRSRSFPDKKEVYHKKS